jgi:hypothetical protein
MKKAIGMTAGLFIMSVLVLRGSSSNILLSEVFDYPDGTPCSTLPTAGPLVRGPSYFYVIGGWAQNDARSTTFTTAQEFGLRTWTDYHVSINFKILQLADTDPDSFRVALYFRAFPTGSYGDRLNIDLRGPKAGNTWTLCSEVRGNWYLLMQGKLPAPLQLNRIYTLEVEVIGTHIRAWLDGALLLSVDESQFVPSKEPSLHLSGSVAIGNSHAVVAFDNLVVTTTSTGRLNVVCDVPVSIQVGNLGTYIAPFDIELPTGVYTIVASYGGQTQTFQVAVSQNMRTNVRIVFAEITQTEI